MRSLSLGVRRRIWVPAMRCGVFLLALLASFHLAAAQGLTPGGPVDFGSIAVGASSPNYTLFFTASTTTTVSSVITTADGVQSQDFILVAQTCTGTLYPGESCNVTVAFSPLHVGLRKGALSILNGSGAVSTRLYLHGIGLGPQIVFSPVTATAMSSLILASPSTFEPSASVIDGAGNLYFNDIINSRIFEQTQGGVVSLIAHQAGTPNSSLALSGDGTLFVSSPSQSLVQAIVPGVSTTQVSTGSIPLVTPAGVAVDGAGFLYIADSQANRIVRVDLTAATSPLVLPLTGLGTPLSSPFGLAVDSTFLYIADSGNGRIVEVSLASGVATAITANNILSNPYGLAVDAAGNLLVANPAAGGLVQVTPTGTVFPITPDTGQHLGTTPFGVTLKPTGDLVVSDGMLGLVYLTRSTGSLTFPTPTKVTFLDSTDGYEALTVQNSGNQPIQFTATDPAFSATTFATGPTNTCPDLATVSTPLAVGATCTYSIGFTPSVVGPNTATLTLQGTAVGPGAAAITAASNLTGTGITQVDTLKVVTNPTSTSPGVPVSFTVSAQEGTTVIPAFTGTVTFTMTDATGAFLSGTTYTFTTADAGVHTFTAPAGAQFNTPGNFTLSAHFGSIVGVSNVVIVRYPANVVVGSSANPVFINNNTSLTATVSSPGVSTVATGTAAFYDGTNLLGTANLINGVATLPTTFTVAGNHSITAVYSGDTTFFLSTSPAYTQVVTDFVAQAALSSSINPSFVNQQTTLTATLTALPGQPGAGTPTGTVTFKDGATTLGVATLVTGIATLPASFATAGAHSLTVAYSGDLTFGPVTSQIYVQTVNDYAAQAVLTSSINPTFVAQQTTLTATISAVAGQTGSTTPTGTVTFKDGATTLGTATLAAGIATLPASFATAGNHALAVVYNGDTSFTAVTSPVYTQVVNNYAAQATLTSSINPTFVAQQTTLTATISAVAGQTGSTTPTGTVTFKDGATTLGTATLVNGVATLPASFTPSGNHLLTAIYSGDSSFTPITSATYTQVVNTYTSQVTLTSSINPSLLNQQTTLTATASPTAGETAAPVPTGAITFKDGATTLGTVTLVNGAIALPASFTTIGNHPLTAVYSGDTSFSASTSAIYTQVVNTFTSQTALTSSINPSLLNQQTALTATVTPTAGQPSAGTPTGTITFKNGVTTLGTATLVNGIATFPASFATAGSYPLTAIYSGDANFIASTSTILTQLVTDYTSQASLISSTNPTFVNQPTTFTATISAAPGQPGAGTPTGTVTFKNGAALLGTATLINGQASLPATFTTPGSYPITAVYSGDVNFLATTTPILTQNVNDYSTTATLTSSLNPTFLNQQTTLTATLQPAPGQPGAGTPTGTVSFYNGPTLLGAATLTGGLATLPVSFATPGPRTLTCVYSGDTLFAAATCPAITQTVNAYTPQAALTSSLNPSFVKQPTTFSVTVGAQPGQTIAGTPTGTVTFKNGATTLGTATLTNGVASLPATFTTPGSYAITAVYSGDATFTGITTAILTQVVNAYAATVTLTSSANPVFLNNPPTLTASVQPAAGQGIPPVPTGTVTFFANGSPLGIATLLNGVATLPASFSVIGSYTLTAIYSGDASFLTATSPALTQVIEDFSFALASGSSGTATVLGGYPTTYTFTVAPLGGATLAGPVTFSLSGFPVGTVAVFAPATLPAGSPSTNITLTVTPPVIVEAQLTPARHGNAAPFALALLILPLAAFRRRRRLTSLFLGLLLCVSALSLTGCITDSSSGYYGNTPQTHTLTVTAYSGPLAHLTIVTLIVQ